MAKFNRLDLTKFSEKQCMALEMLCQPKRGGKTYLEIAAELEIDEKTLYRWRQLPEFVEAITGKAILRLHENLPDVFDAMLRRAKAGEVRCVDLMFKLLGLMVDKKEVEVEVEAGDSILDVAADIERLKAMLGKR